MLDFLTLPENILFTLALAIMLVFAFLEILGLFLGGGLSAMLDQALPDADIDFPDADADLDAGDSLVGNLLGWLGVKGIPLLVLLVVFLLFFGVTGLLIQDYVQSQYEFVLPGTVAVALTLVLTFLFAKAIGWALERFMPKDESGAISLNELIGCKAQITMGIARAGYPCQARATGPHGRSHYIMVEPDGRFASFRAGDIVLLTRHDAGKFYGKKYA